MTRDPVVLVADPSLPLVHLHLYFPVGPALDPPGREGLTTLTNRALIRGTRQRARAAVEEAVEGLGSELWTSSQRHAAGIGGVVLRRHLDAFLAILVEVAAEPAFALEEVHKVRREMIAELEAVADDDGALAQRWFRRTVFAGSPFAHGTNGWVESLEAITEADVVRWHGERYGRAGLVVGAAGAVERAELDARLGPLLAGMPMGLPPAWPPAPASPGEGGTVLVHKAERTQAQIILGHPTIDADHPDVLAVALATHAFGGTFTARLMQSVRVERGLSYGAYARLGADRAGSLYKMSAAPETADVAETLDLLRAEYRRFVDEGLTDAEVTFARDALVHAFAFAMETPALESVQRVRARLLGRPADHVDTYVARLQALDGEAVRAAVRRHLRPQEATAVVVCDAEAVAPTLKGPVRVVDARD